MAAHKQSARYYKKHPHKRKAAEDALTERIQRKVKIIRELDDEFQQALTAHPSDGGRGLSDGFNGALEGDIDTYNAKKAAHLAHQGKDMSSTQLDDFNDILAANANDHGFAEKFATHMGAKGTLNFWAGMNPYDAHGERATQLARTRRVLGTTLGTATRSKSDAMQRWKQEIIKAGDQRFGNNADHDPYGYQLMSDLMYHGDYEDKFLGKYTQSLVDFEKRQLHNGFNDPHDLWHGSQGQPGLYGGMSNNTVNEWGNDPMKGALNALGHSPGASTDFFSHKSNFDYLVGGGDKGTARDWPESTLVSGEQGKNFAPLGHALQSAATGAAYDESHAHELHRGPEQVEIFHKVIAAYGGNKGLMAQQPGVSDGLGRIGAAYIDHLNYGLDNYLDHAPQKGTDHLLGTHGHGINPDDTVGFMHAIGGNQHSHSIVSNAQEVFTASRIHHFEGTEDAYRVAQIGAQGHGALDEGRAEDIGAHFNEKKNELEESANWKKAGAGVAVYGSMGAIGGVAGPAAPVAVPLATGAAGSGMTSAINDAIDADVKSDEMGLAPRSYDDIKAFDRRAELNATDTIHRYMDDGRLPPGSARDREDDLDQAYWRGRGRTDGDNTK